MASFTSQSLRSARNVALLPVVAAALAACGGNKVEGTESVAVAAAPGGGAIVVSTRHSAKADPPVGSGPAATASPSTIAAS